MRAPRAKVTVPLTGTANLLGNHEHRAVPQDFQRRQPMAALP
jgi:hypothetical protein